MIVLLVEYLFKVFKLNFLDSLFHFYICTQWQFQLNNVMASGMVAKTLGLHTN